jgi:succinoglycan biosynthesis protein ExoM
MTRVAVCVCTYRRNEPLTRLLTRLAQIQAQSPHHELAVVVADDNPNATAREIVAPFSSSFALGVHHLVNGTQNISNGRNLLLERALGLADVLVMTDDDCLPEVQWIDALLDTFAASGADAVSGPMLADVPADAPSWIVAERLFQQLESFPARDGPLDHGQTNNCLISCAWLRRHPTHRFDPALGKLGGEDMVFFRGAVALGLRSWFSAAARVHAVETLAELTLPSLLRTYFWLGNSEAVTNLQLRTSGRGRLAVRGARRCLTAAALPLRRLRRGRTPGLRSTSVLGAQALGLVAGALGLRVRHH